MKFATVTALLLGAASATELETDASLGSGIKTKNPDDLKLAGLIVSAMSKA